MSGPNVERADIEAAEYVLGTLDTVNAKRIERALESDAELRRRVVDWETRFGTLGLALEPVEPPAGVWAHIESSLGQSQQPAATSVESAPTSRSTNAPGTRLWQGIAMAASLAAIVLAALLFQAPGVFRASNAAAPAYASLIHDKSTGMSWLVTVKPGSHKMHVLAMGNYDVPNGKTLRAWVKPSGGSALFVGQLPPQHGDYTMKVSDKVARSLGDNARLMVSMDNRGTPSSAGPNGPIMWNAPVARRTG